MVKGTKRNRPKKQEPPERPSPTRYIDKIAALKKQPLKEDALDIMHELAKLVSPLMSRHNFHVGLFCEMFPKSQNLLGLNVNGGLKIMIRLRQHHNNLQFISKSELIGTVLHELTHNKYGAHNQLFYGFLDKITREFEEMMSRNSFNIYGLVNFDNMFGNNSMLNQKIGQETFAGPGQKLGNQRVFKEINRVGGNALKTSKPSRAVILLAIERRLKDNKRCHESLSQEDEKKYIESLGSELPSQDDLDIVVITTPEPSVEEPKLKKPKVINLSEEEEIIEID